MGVTVESLSPGDGVNFPQQGGEFNALILDPTHQPTKQRFHRVYSTDTVKIHYVGTLLDGSKFDSSRDRNDPFITQIGVGKVIKGWDEGVPQLSLGEKAVLTVSADYGYGARGFPPVIPPNSVLKFEVELLKIN